MTARHLQKYHLALICAISTVLVVGASIAAGRVPGFGWLVRWEMRSRDFLARHGRRNPPDPRLLYLGIDNDSVSLDESDLTHLFADIPPESADYRALTLMARQWPWPREIYALLLDKLHAAGARMVVFDLIFPKPAPGDDLFKAALDRYRDQVVVGSNFVPQTFPSGMEGWVHALPPESLIPQSQPLDQRVAFVNFWPDATDGLIRRARFRVTAEGVGGRKPGPRAEVFLSVAARTLTQIEPEELVPSPPDTDWIFRYTAPPGEGFRPLSIYQLFVPKYRAANFANGAIFRNKIIVVGPSGDWQHDEHETPFGSMAGPELHLNAMNALLHGAFLTEASLPANILLVLFSGALAWLLVVANLKPAAQIFCAFFGNVLGVLLALLAFDYLHFYTVIVAPLLAFNLSATGGFTYQFIVEQIEKLRMRRTFERYVSKDIVRELLDNPQSLLHILGASRRPITILFSDLRGFTALTEHSEPVALIGQLNQYFRHMVRVVFAHDGTIDKFVGDGLMAHWGSFVTNGPQVDACNAVRTALQMRSALAGLNAEWRLQGRPPLEIGIGINSGEVIVGDIGCDEKMEVSVMGDAVNLAARIEGATKQYPVDLLIGEAVAALVRDQFLLRTVDLVRVRGKTNAVEVFAVLGERTPGATLPEWLTLYEQAVRHYRGREFALALALCAQASHLQKGDGLIEEYRRRSEAFLHRVPAANWSGIQILDEK